MVFHVVSLRYASFVRRLWVQLWRRITLVFEKMSYCNSVDHESRVLQARL